MEADYSAENTAAAKGDQQMKAVITVIGQDKIGIIYNVTSVLAEYDVNVLDINQTIMQEVFIRIQHEGIFTAMSEL